MKRLISLLIVSVVVCTTALPLDAAVRVRGYYRKDGTYVRPHYRSNPDGNPYNNWSTYPNINPYTGKRGTKHIPGNPHSYKHSLSNDPNLYSEDSSDALLRSLWSYSTKETPAHLKPPDFSQLITYPIVRVVDGDTVVVNENEKNITVRLIGVDTPETVHPLKPVEYYGKEASRFTTNLLKGEKVYLIGDTPSESLDRYERTLAYVYRAPDGMFINAEIIRQGYGHAYTLFPFKYMEEFKQLERFAREAEKGLWAPAQAEQKATSKPIVPPVVKPKSETKSVVEDVIVYVTRTGQCYHRGSCSYLRKSKIPMKLSEARQQYRPCSRCNPPR